MNKEPEDFISPHLENPWMVTTAKRWIAEVSDGDIRPHTGLQVFAWSKESPDAAFAVIQTILYLVREDDHLFMLAAAGPLESFLAQCPEEFIKTVWRVATIDPRLRKAFQGVWQLSMPDDRYKKVQELALQQ